MLYRSGVITPMNLIANDASHFFDAIAHVSGADKLESYQPRSQSVFMAPTYETALVWAGWRREDELDADIWGVTFAGTVQIFYYDVRHYDLFAEYYRNFMSGIFPEYWYGKMVQAVSRYYATASQTAFHGKGEQWEVLVPYSLAEQASWDSYGAANYAVAA